MALLSSSPRFTATSYTVSEVTSPHVTPTPSTNHASPAYTEQFAGEEDAVAHRAKAKGLEYCIVNGLEPVSNRAVLELAERHDNVLPALGGLGGPA